MKWWWENSERLYHAQ